jgi:hypothetical protein
MKRRLVGLGANKTRGPYSLFSSVIDVPIEAYVNFITFSKMVQPYSYREGLLLCLQDITYFFCVHFYANIDLGY